MSQDIFENALAAVTDLVKSTPELRDFAPWPDMEYAPQPVQHIPAADILKSWDLSAAHPACAAIQACADHANWQRTYSEAEVGADFLARYGWFELAGPTGHFYSDQVRVYVGYWGAGLDYPDHHHEAEEIYYVLAGGAEFKSEGEVDAHLTPGQTRFHKSNQTHAMQTHDQPILTLVLWRGSGMAGVPKMGVNNG